MHINQIFDKNTNICPKGEVAMVLDIISTLIPFIALIVSICSFISTNKTSRLQREILEKQKYPNLKVISVESFKSKYGSSDTVYDGKYCRMYYGESRANLSLDNNIAIFDLKKAEICAQIEYGFIDEVKSHININKAKNVNMEEKIHDAYFTYFGCKPYLILNHASNSNSFIIDHSNVKIKLHNYGTPITAISIKSVTVHYNQEKNINLLKFDGDSNNKISLSPQENEEFILFLDEITTDLDDSLCKMTTETYINSPDTLSMLRTHISENRLSYDRIEIEFQCWDMYNTKTILKITFEYNGNFFVSTTTISKGGCY